MDLAQRIVDQILSEGSVVRGWMGVSLRSAEENDELRIIVNGVYRGGPADLAGIQAGDELVSLDGRSFEDTAAVVSYVAGSQPGRDDAGQRAPGREHHRSLPNHRHTSFKKLTHPFFRNEQNCGGARHAGHSTSRERASPTR